MIIELIFDYVIHLFDFIENEVVRAIIQIFSLLILTVLIIGIIFGISKLIMWII